VSDVLQALERQASARADAPAFSDVDTTVDFAALARRVAGFAAAAAELPGRVGLLAPSGIDWLVADLGLWAAGRDAVPLPHFFADEQLRHIVHDADIGAILASPEQIDRAASLGAKPELLRQGEAAWRPTRMTGRRIVYTSGSTGTPKGVLLGPRQIGHTCQALLQAVDAGPDDRHLSVLPFSLLLEAVCGIYLPIMAGGHGIIAPQVVAASGPEIAVRLGEAAQQVRPTTTVLVPQLLQGWVLMAAVGRVEVPDSLRFVAVGGAPVPVPIAERAWELGLPVHEGYGLTECGSVVAVNVPGTRRAGTVGRSLPGYELKIAADGEIIVRSPAVAEGYLNAAPIPGELWPTGDLGRIDGDGYLRVEGRKDNLIVTAAGRNISPEWIETMLLADPRIARAVVLADGDGELAALLEPSQLGQHWFANADETALHALTGQLCADAPVYARPRQVQALPPDGLAERGLLTANGRPRRRAIAHAFRDCLSADTRSTAHAVL
jgi:long-subunit acyl-CoA synthetase (AMP-forming)